MRVWLTWQMPAILTVVRHAIEDLYMGLFSWDRYVVHQAVMSGSERSLISKNVSISGSVRSELTTLLNAVSQRVLRRPLVGCHGVSRGSNIGV